MRGLVLGRGRSTPQVLQSMQWESPLLHGGDVTLADNTAAIQAAHDALPAGGGVIYVPGLWKCTSQLVFSKSILLMGRKDGRSGGGANADGIWFTTTGAPPLTRSAVTGGVRAWLDASSTASPSLYNVEVRGPSGDISNGYIMDWGYATTFVTYDTLINGSATTNLKAHVALGGGQGGAGAFRSTQFSGAAADAGSRWMVDNKSDASSGTMNNVVFEDILLTSCRGAHNPATAWKIDTLRQEVLNGEGILKILIIDAGLPALDQPEVTCIECWAGDVTGLGDGNYFDAAGRIKIIGGQFQLLGSNPALIKAVDPCSQITDEDVAIFSTSPTAHVFDANSKVVTRYRSFGAHLGGGASVFGSHRANSGGLVHRMVQDILTGQLDTDAPIKNAALQVAGIVEETYARDLANTSTGTAPVKDNALYRAIFLQAGDVVTAANFESGTTALTTAGTAPHFWFALLDSASKVVRQSIDDIAATWGTVSLKTKTLDAVPVTAGSRTASTTAVLTLGNLSQDLTTVLTVGDSITVAGASIAAYNGTFAITAVTATTISYVTGGSATDALASPWPTVQLPAGKRTYTVPTSGVYYVGLMVDSGSTGTQPTLTGRTLAAAPATQSPILSVRDATNTVLATAVTAAITAGNVATFDPYGYLT
jgi:hypothetical protein